MDKRELRQYRALLAEIALLEEEQRRIAEGALSAVALTGMPKGSGTADDTGRLAARLADLAYTIAAKLEEAIAVRLRIERAIAGLDGQERVLMRLRYIEGKTWEEIAVAMRYHYRHVLRLHERILQGLAQDRGPRH